MKQQGAQIVLENNTFLIIKPQALIKQRFHNIFGMEFSAPISFTLVELFVLILCFFDITVTEYSNHQQHQFVKQSHHIHILANNKLQDIFWIHVCCNLKAIRHPEKYLQQPLDSAREDDSSIETELQGSCKSVNVHLCCQAQKHNADLHTANQILICTYYISLPNLSLISLAFTEI